MYPDHYDFPTSPLIWGAVIFVAVVGAWLLVANAIQRLRNRRSDGRAVEEGHREDPRFVHTLADIWHMTDEFPLADQTRGQRKAIKERRKAHEKAQKHRNKS
jgi:hypothetical protein